jgi:hypothetical protein
MDAALYLQRLKEEISTLREEKALLQEINDIDVIDAFEVKPKKKKKRSLKPGTGRGSHYSFMIDDRGSDIVDDFFKWKTNGTGTIDIGRVNKTRF